MASRAAATHNVPNITAWAGRGPSLDGHHLVAIFDAGFHLIVCALISFLFISLMNNALRQNTLKKCSSPSCEDFRSGLRADQGLVGILRVGHCPGFRQLVKPLVFSSASNKVPNLGLGLNWINSIEHCNRLTKIYQNEPANDKNSKLWSQKSPNYARKSQISPL